MIIQGDALAELRKLPSESVHCCVTSPPYFGLRDYGFEGQIGLERTPEEYVSRLVEVFREVRRVLRDDGVLWLNLGDSYATGAGKVGNHPGGGDQGERWKGHRGSRGNSPKHSAEAVGPMIQPNRMPLPGLKPKDLIGIPWRVAFALQADGWYLRSDIIWAKPNPMPESVTDRCTTSKEHVFMLTKSGSPTFWTHRDHEGSHERPVPDYRWINNLTEEETAIEPDGWREVVYYTVNGKTPHLWRRINLWRGHDYFYDNEAVKEPAQSTAPSGNGFKGRQGKSSRCGPLSGGEGTPEKWDGVGGSRNRRDVWTITTKPYKGAHFATMPPDLVEVCIKAGTSERGCCQICGAPWVRVVRAGELSGEARIQTGPRPHADATGRSASSILRTNGRTWREHIDLGFRPSCGCGADPVPCTVLDPFAGSGTTGAVAKSLGRDYILIEANPDYIQLIEERVGEVEAPPLTLTDMILGGEG